MKYFQEYEKLRKENSIITPGSIWGDSFGRIEVISVTRTRVYYKGSYPSEDTRSIYLKIFKNHFHRVG